ncbi:MAG: DUF4296 domain-containing protein [Chryseobacterium sp.]|nr:DUF4296 domain-containing protein [Candidatus Chryseobacterium enterohippi]
MKRLVGLFVFLFMISCSEYINKPENLVDTTTMAEIMADMAINDQVSFTFINKNLESGTRFILKEHNVKAQDFVDSYKYYVMTKKMNKIVDKAQEVLLEKDPKAEQFVKDKLGKSTNLPALEK